MAASKSQQLDILQETSRTCRLAVERADLAAPDRDSLLQCLLDALIAVYETNGDSNVLEEAIVVLQEILLLRPGGHPRRGSSLIAYGTYLQWSFTRHSSNPALVKLCMDVIREALQLRSLSLSERIRGLQDLSVALRTEFRESGGDLPILTDAISTARECLELSSPAESLRVAVQALNCLATTLLFSWEHLGDFPALSEAISLLRQSLSLCPPGHSRDRFMCLHNLAASLLHSYWHRGDFAIVTEAIALQREALPLVPPGRRGACLGNLGYFLLTRYEHKGDPGSLAEATELFREALELRPAGHPNRMDDLGHLADALLRDLDRRGDLNALAEAIALLREALELYPLTHARRSHAMDILGKALVIRFQRHGDMNALMQAVDVHREALQLRPEGHPERPLALSNIRPTLHVLFEYRNDAQALEEEAAVCRMGLLSCPEGHSKRGYFLSSLGSCLHQPCTAQFDFLGGLSYIALGLADYFASTRERLHNTIQCLHQMERAYRFVVDEHDVLESSRHKMDLAVLEVYILTIRLLPRTANLGLNHAARLSAVSGSDVVSRNAAVRAMALGREPEAVEMLEEGRGVFWSQTLQLRASGMDHIHKDDRHELQRIFRLLEEGINRIDVPDLSVAQRESQAEARRQLSEQAEELIAKLRSQPGLERLLMPPAFSSLIQRIPQGFVVMLLASDLGHRALILRRDYSSVRSIELEPSVSGLLSEITRTTLPRDWDGPHDVEQDIDVQRLKMVKSKPNHSVEPLVSTLANLWSSVVKPVIEALGLKKATGRDRPRLWWCVTGELSFLPIHAAGVYGSRGSECAGDYIVSSYVPTLSALIKAHKDWTPIARAEISGLVVCEPSQGQRFLRHVEREVSVVRTCFETASAHVLNPPAVHISVPELQSLLRETTAHILHLACHGMQDSDPLQSSFTLGDGNLSIEHIMELNLPHAVLAYLSACHTAKGSQNQPDQSVHLAASMLFCGFRSVIGTMWSMSDQDGPNVARRVYEAMFERRALDLDDIAYALDDAVSQLRKSGVPASRWASLVHVGG